MTVTRTHSSIVICLAVWLACASSGLSAQESLAQAKDLYAAAAYDEALAMFERLPDPESADAGDIAMYRVLCLFALGRNQDGQSAMAALVTAHPEYRPSDLLTSPHIRTVFHQVRRRLLPQIVQRWYTDARAAFDRKEPRDAAARFDRVIGLLDDEDARDVPGLADFRALNVGFRDLSRTAAAVSAAAVAPPPPAVNAAGNTPPAAASAAGMAPAVLVYDENDATVVPPTVVSQKIPRWQYSPRSAQAPDYRGVLELVIDTRGHC